ncbi:MAG: molybdopterin molybdotransferase MoeA [Lachnospiraceae bacterium]|nr:molybdopterin molybdotransferase MoeA [Lachnospiraceae bacterium]
MLNVKTPQEVWELIEQEFDRSVLPECVPLSEAAGRVLARDVLAGEYVPDFNRSTVDGYAVRAKDTFGCSDSMPALLMQAGQVNMGEGAGLRVAEGVCVSVPTGGEVPDGADAMVMVEYTEDYGDGTIGILKPVAPGANMIYRGDDVAPGRIVLKAGKRLMPQDVGAMAAMGISGVTVAGRPRVGIISTGDELVPVDEAPGPGQIRDVNSTLLQSLLLADGAEAVLYGIVKDQKELLVSTVERALQECDMVLISGGSSVGAKDATCQVIEEQGSVLIHGIAMKPGKPTILGKAGEKPVVGLPGHPVAAFFVTRLFVLPLLDRLTGLERCRFPVKAMLEESVGANHGRAQYMGVFLRKEGNQIFARPIRSKSGLITSLAGAAGYFCIARDCEGMAAGTEIDVEIL